MSTGRGTCVKVDNYAGLCGRRPARQITRMITQLQEPKALADVDAAPRTLAHTIDVRSVILFSRCTIGSG